MRFYSICNRSIIVGSTRSLLISRTSSISKFKEPGLVDVIFLWTRVTPVMPAGACGEQSTTLSAHTKSLPLARPPTMRPSLTKRMLKVANAPLSLGSRWCAAICLLSAIATTKHILVRWTPMVFATVILSNLTCYSWDNALSRLYVMWHTHIARI